MKEGGVTKKIVIIGGGAAGMMAAVSAGKCGAEDITVIERNDRTGRKLMITGKGRCNVTNNCDSETLIKNTLSNPKFLYSAFREFSSADTMNFFENCGVKLKTERGNRVFPESDKAVSIVDALTREAKKYSTVKKGRAVKIETHNGRVTAVVLESGETVAADAVILATGGMSYPLTGSTGDGYALAKELSHTVTVLRPSLVRLVCHEGFCSRLAGLTLKNVTLALYEDKKDKPVFKELGEMLFTHSGISGPLTLCASAYMKSDSGYSVLLDLKPALDESTLDKRILRDFDTFKNKDFANSLSALLPKSIIPVIIKLSGIAPDLKVNSISREQRKKLVSVIKGLRLTVCGTGPVDEAVVTKGGISVKEISPSTMESKLVGGLYFAGEVMDVDAFTGGFNLQIAFSTGFVAGKSAAGGEAL